MKFESIHQIARWCFITPPGYLIEHLTKSPQFVIPCREDIYLHCCDHTTLTHLTYNGKEIVFIGLRRKIGELHIHALGILLTSRNEFKMHAVIAA